MGGGRRAEEGGPGIMQFFIFQNTRLEKCTSIKAFAHRETLGDQTGSRFGGTLPPTKQGRPGRVRPDATVGGSFTDARVSREKADQRLPN